MSSRKPKARLTQGFLTKVAASGLTDAAAARAIGVSRQFYSAVKNGQENPSVAFMTGAVHAGLADTFDAVAEPVPTTSKDAA